MESLGILRRFEKVKNRLFSLSLVFFSVFFLHACGNNANPPEDIDKPIETEVDEKHNDDTTKKGENEEDAQLSMQEKMENVEYKEFELEVDYGENNEYEAKIEQHENTGTIEAKLEDEVKENIEVKGEEAFELIYPHVETLTINRESSKDEAIDQILNAFDLPADYEKIEIELTFQDGTKIEYKDRR